MSEHGLPEEQAKALARAKRLAWSTLFWLATTVAAMFAAMGSSQAMRAAWIEDCLSFIPPAVFLIAGHQEHKQPTKMFPGGFTRFGSLMFLVAASALTAMGGFLLIESAITLMAAEHPTIGSVEILGNEIWLGWIMIAALGYSVVPTVILGRLKLPLARATHDKVLFTDANMNKADWITALAGIVGLVLVGFGFWWADAVAAGIIALDVLNDGLKALRSAGSVLADSAPRDLESPGIDPLAEQLQRMVDDVSGDGKLQLRETGRFVAGTLKLKGTADTAQAHELAARLAEMSWRITDISVGRHDQDKPDGRS